MPKLIIDADDFGLSKAINHGIIESYKTGITTSTLLMPNLETAEHGVHLAKDHPDLFIGQHTNFLLGKPCANPAENPITRRHKWQVSSFQILPRQSRCEIPV